MGYDPAEVSVGDWMDVIWSLVLEEGRGGFMDSAKYREVMTDMFFYGKMPDPEPEPAEEVKEEAILELTDRYEPPVVESIGDLDISAAEDPEPEPFPTAFQPEPRPAYAEPAPSETSAPVESLVGASAAASAASAFAGLSASLARPEPAALAGGSGPTIDALARELLRPMLKEWLDENLPGIVEAAVRKEVERIARSAG